MEKNLDTATTGLPTHKSGWNNPGVINHQQVTAAEIMADIVKYRLVKPGGGPLHHHKP
jgi:hypothetical protein